MALVAHAISSSRTQNANNSLLRQGRCPTPCFAEWGQPVLPGEVLTQVKPMTLKWNLVTKGMRPRGQLRQKLQQKIGKLEAHLEHFPPDAVFLQVNLERHPKKLWFTGSLTLRVPSNILHAEKSGADPVPAFDQAVKALLRELAGLKSALRHENKWRRFARPEDLPAVGPAPFVQSAMQA